MSLRHLAHEPRPEDFAGADCECITSTIRMAARKRESWSIKEALMVGAQQVSSIARQVLDPFDVDL